jgi:uncharacterized membrane protein YkoI
MRFLIVLASLVSPQPADARPVEKITSEKEVCLSREEHQSLVASKQALPAAQAIRTARSVQPNSEILRARLCRSGERMYYRVTLLRRDGKVVPVMVEAASGRLIADN